VLIFSRTPAIAACLALCLITHSAWLPIKAWLAHHLISHSWQQSQKSKRPIQPWPWADTSPIAKMTVARLGKELILLKGVDPTSLAFSAGVMHQYSKLTSTSPFVIAGHRDTHFRFLKDIIMQDIISLTDKNGINQLYQVQSMEIVDSEESAMLIDEQDPSLVLITCYPFDALQAGGSLRYVITARLLKN